MNDQELVKWARECTTIGGDCANCPFDGILPAGDNFCADLLVRTLAERVEKLGEHCARYAEEIAVMQEEARRDAEL